MLRKLLGFAAVLCFCSAAFAGKADVQFVELVEKSPGHWRISVTCRHDDEDMKHYCDWWRVRSPDGTVNQTRKLAHPHGKEPFTRSLEDVEIHHSVMTLTVEAHCNVHGLGGKTVKVDFGFEKGPGFRIVRYSRPEGTVGPEQIARLIEQMGGGTMSDRMRASNIQKKLARIGKPAVPQLIEAASGHKDPWVRIWAMGALGRMREPSAIDCMIANTRNRHATVRLVATGQLVRFATRDKRITPVLAERMGDASADVRNWAARGLLRVRDPAPEVIQTLEKNVKADDVEVAIQNLELLARIRDRKNPFARVKAATKDPDPKVRSAAYGAMAKIPPQKGQVKEYVELFFKALADESDRVRREGVRGIQWVLQEGADSMPRDLYQLIGFQLDAELPKMLDSSYDLLRGDALLLLSLRKRSALLDRVLARFKDESSYVREKALRALANTGRRTQGAGDALFAALNDEDQEVRKTAFNAVVWFIGKEKAKKVLSSGRGKRTHESMSAAAQKWWRENRARFPR